MEIGEDAIPFGNSYREWESPNSPNNRAYRELMQQCAKVNQLFRDNPEEFIKLYGMKVYLTKHLVINHSRQSLDSFLSQFPQK